MTEPREDSSSPIDAIVAALQSPARAEELEGEEALVEAMASAVAAIDHEEPASMTLRSRPLKFGLIAGVAVLSVAGVAAAATGALPERRPDRPVATTVLETTSTSPQATAVDVTAVDPTVVDPATTLAPSTSPTEVVATTAAEPWTPRTWFRSGSAAGHRAPVSRRRGEPRSVREWRGPRHAPGARAR